MHLNCIHCGYISKSLLIPKEEALAEIMGNFAKHLTQVHKDKHFQSWLQDSAVITSIAPTIVMLAKHTTFLDNALMEEDFMQLKFSELVDKLQDCLGIEVFDSKPPAKLASESLPTMS